MPSRLHGELDERKAMASRALNYHTTFLDDYLRGILPNDLVVLGAPSGMGKTDLALGIAASNAASGHPVAYFALEAEPRELERRTKYKLLAKRAHAEKHPRRYDLNYADWLLGNCEDIVGHNNAAADHDMLSKLGRLWTYYRGTKFGAAELHAKILEVHERVDLIVVDHLHYVDTDTDENEARALGEVVKTIRDVALRIGKPILLVAHLRKRDQRQKQCIATLDDFHGSSNVVKIATQVIALEHAYDVESPKWYLAPTYVTILKDRRAGAPRLVALCSFDKRTGGYADAYSLGKFGKGGATWEELELGDRPSWARHCRSMEAS
jgi:replicative DNA helicase